MSVLSADSTHEQLDTSGYYQDNTWVGVYLSILKKFSQDCNCTKHSCHHWSDTSSGLLGQLSHCYPLVHEWLHLIWFWMTEQVGHS